MWGLPAVPRRTKVSEAGGDILGGWVFLPVLSCRQGIHDVSTERPCLVALWNDNISMQSGIVLCSNTSLGHRGEICIKLRGVTGRIWRTKTTIPVQVLYLKNVEALALHGRWSPSAGFRAPISAFYCFGLYYSAPSAPKSRRAFVYGWACSPSTENRQQAVHMLHFPGSFSSRIVTIHANSW